jgi:hypothetical protein
MRPAFWDRKNSRRRRNPSNPTWWSLIWEARTGWRYRAQRSQRRLIWPLLRRVPFLMMAQGFKASSCQKQNCLYRICSISAKSKKPSIQSRRRKWRRLHKKFKLKISNPCQELHFLNRLQFQQLRQSKSIKSPLRNSLLSPHSNKQCISHHCQPKFRSKSYLVKFRVLSHRIHYLSNQKS